MTYPRGRVVLTATQTAQVLRVSPSTLRDWVARGHIRKRSRNRYDLAEIMDYLDRRPIRV